MNADPKKNEKTGELVEGLDFGTAKQTALQKLRKATRGYRLSANRLC